QSATTACHQRLCTSGQGGKAVAGYLVRDAEGFTAGVRHKAAFERLTRREGDRVYDDVELAPFALKEVKRRIDLIICRDVELHRQLGSQRLRQGFDTPFHPVVRVREGELRPLTMHRLCDAPRDRAIGRDANDERALAGEKSHCKVSAPSG